jgi:uncharacterized membrane protein (UPF0127 family)
MARLLVPALALAFLFAGCGEEPSRPAPPAEPAVEIPFRHDGTLTFLRNGGEEIVTIDIEIAQGDSATQRGMMQRTSFPDRSGMLFLMPRVERHGFWMANTPLSLDITFVAPDSTVINTAKYTVPYSTESVYAEAPARFIVETLAGFTDTWGITAGDRVRWTRSDAAPPTPAAVDAPAVDAPAAGP